MLTTRGYQTEDVETEDLCRAVIDKAFPDLTAELAVDASTALSEQLSLLAVQKRQSTALATAMG